MWLIKICLKIGKWNKESYGIYIASNVLYNLKKNPLWSPFIIIHNYESSTDLLVKSEPEEAEFLIGLYNVPSKHANDQEVVKTITSKCKFCDSSFSTKTNLNHMYPQSMKERSHSNVKFATIVAVENFTWINMLPQTMKEKSHSNVKFVTMAV